MPRPSRTCAFGASYKAAYYSLSACYLKTFWQLWHVIHCHPHFLLTIITHVRRSNGGGHEMGPMQYFLITTTLFKSQKILFNARAPSSNLIHRILSTSQLPILDPPSQLHYLLHFPPVLPPLMGFPPPRASRVSVIHVFLVSIFENLY